MSGLFGGKPDTSAQEAQLELQRKQIEAQEARQNKEAAEEAMKLQAAMRARQRGGRRALLASTRDDSELGLGGDEVKLS